MKRRTEITIETERLLIIHRRKPPARAWCPSCDVEVQMITADEAAQLSFISSRLIYRLVEADELHYVETPENRLLICMDSLKQLLEGVKTT
jgi:hypothetical protein